MKVNATEAWKKQIETLKYVMEELKKELLDMKAEILTISDLTLQGRMMCSYKDNQHTRASWEFGFRGQRFLFFDSENREYTVDHSGGELLKEKWQNDKELTKTFTNISGGDCREWLEIFLVNWKKELETAAVPTTATATPQYKATTNMSVTVILSATLTCLTVFGIFSYAVTGRRCCSEAPESVV